VVDGYIKLYRKTVKSQVFQSEGLFKVWAWCLLKASHEGRWVSVKTGRGNTEVWVGPGQFIFGRKTAAKELKMNPETVRKRMMTLKNMQNCTMQSTSHYTLVTVANWDFYQGDNKKVPGKYQAKTQKVPPKSTTQSTPENQIEQGFQESQLKNVPPPLVKKTGKRYHKQECIKQEEDIYAHFCSFWKEYPHKVAKKKAHEAWQKLEKAEDVEALLPILLDAIAKQKQAKETAKAKGEFSPEWPYPATWLNGRRWEDEIEIKKRWDHAG